MAAAAFAERLREIDQLDEKAWRMYHGLLAKVEPQIAQLRAVLANARDRRRERVWLKGQTDGELDDARLVEGLAGERLVFKRRGRAPDTGRDDDDAEARRSRRLLFVMDVSGSMYRFNGMDGRLERMLESTALVLEALGDGGGAGADAPGGAAARYEFAVVGHSGDAPAIDFVEFGAPPSSRGEILKVLQKMVAHTQFCMPGDHTIEATRDAVRRALEGHDVAAAARPADDDDEAEENRPLVVVLSDANFERYGLDPRWWADALMAEPRVEGFAIMVGSLGDEAQRVASSLPPGRAYIVNDTSELPLVFRRIFEQARLFDDEL